MVYFLLLKFTVTEYYRFVQFIFVTEMLQAERMTFYLYYYYDNIKSPPADRYDSQISMLG
jgi:hypothetical protein